MLSSGLCKPYVGCLLKFSNVFLLVELAVSNNDLCQKTTMNSILEQKNMHFFAFRQLLIYDVFKFFVSISTCRRTKIFENELIFVAKLNVFNVLTLI